MSDNWRRKESPPLLEARFEFSEFRVLMNFLDSLADVAKKMNHHPNISFSRKHASIVIYSTKKELESIDFKLADEINAKYREAVEASKGMLE